MVFLLFLLVLLALLGGYPIAWTLAGVSLLFALLGVLIGQFEWAFLTTMPSRIFSIMSNQVLLSLPLFILMGAILEKSRIAEDLLKSIGLLLGSGAASLALATIVVGALIAATTGIVGAGVIALGILALPTMLKNRYAPSVAAGAVIAAGTLGQIVPPSIVLIILGDALSNAVQQAQMTLDNPTLRIVSIGDLFLGALLPGLGLAGLYILYLLVLSRLRPHLMPPLAAPPDADSGGANRSTRLGRLALHMLPPLLLIILVLGSVITGLATPAEAASIGCLGAFLLFLFKQKTRLSDLRAAIQNAALITTQIFFILIAASFFALVLRGYGGDTLLENLLLSLPGDKSGALLATLLLIFVLGFFLEFIEIVVILVPTLAPILIGMGVDPLWLGILIAICLQTSFLTPPLGFAIFYLRSVAPPDINILTIYKGSVPFIVIQLAMLLLVWWLPQLATYLPYRLSP